MLELICGAILLLANVSAFSILVLSDFAAVYLVSYLIDFQFYRLLFMNIGEVFFVASVDLCVLEHF